MLFVKWKALFAKDTATKKVVYTFEGYDLDCVNREIHAFVNAFQAQGWCIVDNEILSIVNKQEEACLSPRRPQSD